MEFIYNADRFFNVKPRTKTDKALAMLSTSLFFKKNVSQIVQAYSKIQIENAKPVAIQIEKYSGENIFVNELASFLKESLADNIMGAYVHGSLATQEEIPYSDFDALIILRNDTFSSSKKLVVVAEKLFESSKYFFKFDPLQHHRWFVIPEKYLDSYPETFFPVELFKYSKSLFDNGTEIKISPSTSVNFTKPFLNLSASIIKNIDAQNIPTHMYSLKSLLSEFMLLPAFYVQARDKQGVFKKFSFDAAKKDFTKEEWNVMDEASHIRKIWHYELTDNERKLLSKHDFFSRQKIKKHSVAIPPAILLWLTKDFYLRMKSLALQMQNKIAPK